MTYIEFFDASSVENVVSCLAQPPEKVYLLGGDPIALEKACRLYEEIFGERAAELDITVIEPVEMTDADFEKKSAISGGHKSACVSTE